MGSELLDPLGEDKKKEIFVSTIICMDASQMDTHHSLHVYQAEPLADVIADDYQVRLEESPTLRAGSVVELEAVFALARPDFEYEGLVHVSEQVDGCWASEVMAALADSPIVLF